MVDGPYTMQPELAPEIETARARFGLRLQHIGIVVVDFDQGARIYWTLGYRPTTDIIDDPLQKVRVQFVQLGSEVPIELIVPAADDSPVRTFLDKTRGGLYHLCFETRDLDGLIEFVREHRGLVLGRPVRAVAFQSRRIVFVYWDHNLIEFVEQRNDGQQQVDSGER